jgi:Cu/Ag efflux protein CusF
MKKILVAAAASLAFMGAAYAGTVEGVVKSVDPTTKTITLEDGTQVVAGADVTADTLGALKDGTKVQVTLDEGSTSATAVEVVK